LAGDGLQGYQDGAGTNAEFYNPYGVTADSCGNVLVADLGNNLIRKITPAGVVTTLAGDMYDLTNGVYPGANAVMPTARRRRPNLTIRWAWRGWFRQYFCR